MSCRRIMCDFFELEVKDSKLFKLRKKINSKLKELDRKSLKEDTKREKNEELKILKKELTEQRKNSMNGEMRDWFEKLVNNAISLNRNKNETSISLLTHPIKLTHSSIKGATNIFFENTSCNNQYFSTSSILDKKLDIGYPDNKLAPVGKLLLFLYEKNCINRIPTMNDFNIFKPFAENDEQFKKWIKGFSLYFHVNILSSHSLAKQMYFPIVSDYHMISPLVSSTLEQSLFEKIQYSKAKERKKNREQKRDGKYHQDINIWYPNLAILKVTASQNGNASLLNGKRMGVRYLFPSTPPQWKSSIKPPLNSTSLFLGEYERRVWKQIKELQEYLLKITDNKPNMYIRDNVRGSINWIIDTLFNYVAEIQNLKELRGWSQEEGKLKESHRLWLDPYCEDKLFQTNRKNGKWQDEVCLDFGLWLNKKLEHKEMLFVKINSDRWAKILKGRLREFERDLEVLR